MEINPNDFVSLKYIADQTGKFTELDIKVAYKELTKNEIGIMLELVYSMADYDYDFEDSYVSILLTQLIYIIKF